MTSVILTVLLELVCFCGEIVAVCRPSLSYWKMVTSVSLTPELPGLVTTCHCFAISPRAVYDVNMLAPTASVERSTRPARSSIMVVVRFGEADGAVAAVGRPVDGIDTAPPP